MANDLFHHIARTIVRSYQTDELPAPRADDDTYALTFDHELKIYVIGTQQGYLNIVAIFPAHALWLTEKGLAALLRENRFHLTHPVVQIGLDEAGDHLVLCLRQPLEALTPESAIVIFRAFLQQATGLYAGNHAPVKEKTSAQGADIPAKPVPRMAIKHNAMLDRT